MESITIQVTENEAELLHSIVRDYQDRVKSDDAELDFVIEDLQDKGFSLQTTTALEGNFFDITNNIIDQIDIGVKRHPFSNEINTIKECRERRAEGT